jgi:hypothetical protein
MAGLTLFAAVHIDRPVAMQLFLVGMQALIVGLHFAFWAMLPNTIEYGEQATGLRVEGAVFGRRHCSSAWRSGWRRRSSARLRQRGLCRERPAERGDAGGDALDDRAGAAGALAVSCG